MAINFVSTWKENSETNWNNIQHISTYLKTIQVISTNHCSVCEKTGENMVLLAEADFHWGAEKLSQANKLSRAAMRHGPMDLALLQAKKIQSQYIKDY